MFRENRGLYLAGFFFLIVAVGFLYLDRGGKVTPTTSASPSPAPSPVVGIGANQLAQVVIHGKGKVLTVARQGNAFTYSVCAEGQGACPTQPADVTKTAQLFSAVATLTPTHVVYGAPDGMPAYGVDKPTNGEIDIKGQGGQQVTLVVGIKTPDGASYFVRRQDSSDVLVVTSGSIDTQFLALIDAPPVPTPSPSPSTGPVPSPSPS